MSGPEHVLSIVFSLKKYLRCKIFGLSSSKSILVLYYLINRSIFGLISAGGDVGIKLAAW
jgi:hypothetical protein